MVLYVQFRVLFLICLLAFLPACPSGISSDLPQLKVTASFGGPDSSDTGLLSPAGICFRTVSGSYSAIIAVADKGNDRVVVWGDKDGAFVKMRSLSAVTDSSDRLLRPTDVAITQQYPPFTDYLNPDSILFYVSDAGNDRIVIYDAQGNLVRFWGQRGSLPGELMDVAGIDVDHVGNIYVADRGNHRIQVFDSLGSLVAVWGEYGPLPGQFSYPADVSVGLNKDRAVANILVSDSGNNRVQVFDSAMTFKFSIDGLEGLRQVDANHLGYSESRVGFAVLNNGTIVVLGDGMGLVSLRASTEDGIDPYGIDGFGFSVGPFDLVLYISDQSSGTIALIAN